MQNTTSAPSAITWVLDSKAQGPDSAQHVFPWSNLSFTPTTETQAEPAPQAQQRHGITVGNLPEISVSLRGETPAIVTQAHRELGHVFQELAKRVLPGAEAPLHPTTPGEILTGLRAAQTTAPSSESPRNTSSLRLDQVLQEICTAHNVSLETPWGTNNFASLARAYAQLALLQFAGAEGSPIRVASFQNAGAEKGQATESIPDIARQIVSSDRAATTLWFDYDIHAPKSCTELTPEDVRISTLLAGAVGVKAGGGHVFDHKIPAGVLPLSEAVGFVTRRAGADDPSPSRYLLHFPIDLVVESKALEGSPEGSTVRLSGTDLDGFLVNGVWSIAERPSAQGECSTFLTVSQGKSTVLDAARSALLEDANRFQASQRVDSFHVLGHLVEGLLRSTTNDLNKLQNGRTFEAAHNAEYVAELGCSSIPQRVASLKGWTQGLLDTAVRNLPDAVIPPIRAATQALNTALDVYSAKHEAVRDWISDLREQNAQLSTWGTRGTAIFLGLLGVGSVTSFSTPAFLKPLADAGFIPEVPWDTLGALAFIAVGTGVAYTYWKQNWNNMMISGDHGDSLPRRIARAFYPQKDQAGK